MDIAVIFSAIECGGDDWHWAGGAGPEDAWSVGNVMSGLAGIVCRLGWGGPGHDVSRSSRTLGWYWDENRREKYGRRAGGELGRVHV